MAIFSGNQGEDKPKDKKIDDGPLNSMNTKDCVVFQKNQNQEAQR